MARKALTILAGLLILALILEACGRNTGQEQETGTAIPAAKATLVPTALSRSAAPITLTVQTKDAAPITLTTPFISTPTNTPIPATTAPALSSWQTRWLKGIPCRPPCFEGITLGQTGAPEAFKLVQQNPFANTNTIINHPPPDSSRPDNGEIDWDWLEPPTNAYGGGIPGVRAFYHAASKLKEVYLVTMDTPSDLKLKDVIKTYGEPDYISALFHPHHRSPGVSFYVSIIYLSQGFILFGNSGENRPEINGDLTFQLLNFFAPGSKGYDDALPGDEYHYFTPWKGFNTYNFYCRNRPLNTNQDCKTVTNDSSPVPTPTLAPTVNSKPSSTPTLVPATTAPTFSDWQARWLKGISCRPPCWEGIIPGKTTLEEAVKILEKSPLFNQDQF